MSVQQKILLKSLGIKLKEALLSVLPVSLIVVALNLTPLVNFSSKEILVFIISSVALVVGIGLFNLGADLAMTPMGEHVGAGLTKSKSRALLLIVVFIMGLLVTIAEPDLSVLAKQVKDLINGTTLIVTVGLGVGLLLVLSVLKIVFKKQLSSVLMFLYMALFALVCFVVMQEKTSFLATAFDSGGVTTGPITVPFIMALGVGIAATIGGKNSAENSFGLIAICSVGPILAVIVLGMLSNGEVTNPTPSYNIDDNLGPELFNVIGRTVKEVAIALVFIVISFVALQLYCLKLPKKKLLQMGIGIAYTFFGLVIFLASVTVGFMPIGFKLGKELASNSNELLVTAGFVIGTVVVLAEPAVHVLKRQVEEITGGTVSKRSMLLALSIGVGISIGLSMLRICLDFSILYYVIPGYILSLGLSFFVPGIYTAIAFDSGGVASGPLTSGFILPMAVGACITMNGSVLENAFGVVAMVAMTPLITIQILGFRAIVARRVKVRKTMRRILAADDEQIIDFM